MKRPGQELDRNNKRRRMIGDSLVYDFLDNLNEEQKIATFEMNKKAAESGNINSYYVYAHMLKAGVGCKADINLSAKMFNDAAARGDLKALYCLGECMLFGEGMNKNELIAFNIFVYCALKGVVSAMYRSAVFLIEGKVVAKNINMAVALLKHASEKKHIPSMNRLAHLYFHGEDVVKDIEMAASLLKEAAIMGNNLCQYGFANILLIKNGFKKNNEEAIKYLKLSGRGGYAPALHALGLLYKQDNIAKSVEYYRKSAEFNHPKAIYLLAKAYESGNGVDKDIVQSLKLYVKSVQKGAPAADKVRRMLSVSIDREPLST